MGHDPPHLFCRAWVAHRCDNGDGWDYSFVASRRLEAWSTGPAADQAVAGGDNSSATSRTNGHDRALGFVSARLGDPCCNPLGNNPVAISVSRTQPARHVLSMA